MNSLSKRISYLTSEGGPTRRTLKTDHRLPYQGKTPEARAIKGKPCMCLNPRCRKWFTVETTDVRYCSIECNQAANP